MSDLIKKEDAIEHFMRLSEELKTPDFRMAAVACANEIKDMPTVDCVPLNTELPGREYYITAHKDAEGYLEWFKIERASDGE